ncbi:unnamed protein product [Prunus armeniaca]
MGMESWWSKFISVFQGKLSISKSVSAYHLAYPKVSFWTREGDGNRSNCCSWDGVECDEDFGHVVGLDLRSSCLYSSINSTLSSALFTCRGLTSQIITSIFLKYHQGSVNLSSLTYLNLSNSLFSGEIPSKISKLSKLSTLDMSFNDQKANDSTPLKLTKGNLRSVVQNLTNIKKLHLSGVHIYSTVPDILVNASSLTSLQLDNCGLYGEFPVGIFHLPNLRDLGYNHLQGPIPRYSPMEKSDLSDSWVEHVTRTSANSTAINQILCCRKNEYTGEISPMFCNFNNLQVLELSNNNLSGMLPQCLGNSSVFYNKLQGKLPRGVMNCTQLKVLNFANNPMSDIFQSWFGALPELRIHILRSNGFHGVIGKHATKHEFPNLRIIDLSSNGFSSMLPSNYLEIWNSMKYVDENQRTYFEVFTDVVGGEYFYFHYTMKISGKGVELKYDKTPYLVTLIDVSSNRFEGEIPEGPVGNLRAFPPVSPLSWQGEP